MRRFRSARSSDYLIELGRIANDETDVERQDRVRIMTTVRDDGVTRHGTGDAPTSFDGLVTAFAVLSCALAGSRPAATAPGREERDRRCARDAAQELVDPEWCHTSHGYITLSHEWFPYDSIVGRRQVCLSSRVVLTDSSELPVSSPAPRSLASFSVSHRRREHVSVGRSPLDLGRRARRRNLVRGQRAGRLPRRARHPCERRPPRPPGCTRRNRGRALTM